MAAEFVGWLPLLLLFAVLPAGQNGAQRALAYCFGYRTALILQAPGVIAHEFAHLLVSATFRHRIDKVCWFTSHPFDNGSVGYVYYRYLPQSFPQTIGVCLAALAPVLLLPLGIGWAIRYLASADNLSSIYGQLWQLATSMHLGIQSAVVMLMLISLHVCPSRGDLLSLSVGLSALAKVSFRSVLATLLVTLGGGYLVIRLGVPLVPFMASAIARLWRVWFAGISVAFCSFAVATVMALVTRVIKSRFTVGRG